LSKGRERESNQRHEDRGSIPKDSLDRGSIPKDSTDKGSNPQGEFSKGEQPQREIPFSIDVKGGEIETLMRSDDHREHEHEYFHD
jgi:hypothetical protein